MTPHHARTSAPDPALAPIRAFDSLTWRDANAVRETVRTSGALFTVEEHEDYDGFLSLLLTALEDGACYLVSGRIRAVELAAIRGDELEPIGRYASVGAAMVVLRERLERALWARG